MALTPRQVLILNNGMVNQNLSASPSPDAGRGGMALTPALSQFWERG